MDYELISSDKDDAYDPAPFLSYARAKSTDKQDRDADVADAVHYWDALADTCRAALVIGLREAELGEPPTADLYVFDRFAGHGDIADVPHVEKKHHHTWHWPCGGQ